MNKIHFNLRKGIYPYRTGGMEIFNYYIIKSLANFYCVSYSAYLPLNFTTGKFHKLRNLRPSAIFEPLQLLFFLLKHEDIKTVIYSFSLDSWIAWWLYTIIQKKTKIDYVVVIHYGKNPSLKHKKILRRFFLSAKKVIAVSKDIKTKYDALYGINCEICFPLVPFKKSNLSKCELRMKYDIPQNVNVISMIGSLKKLKNPLTLLNSLLLFDNDALNMYKPYILYAGDGSLRKELEKISVKHKLTQYVRFLGVVPKEQINEIFELSDLYIISSDFEGTSVSLLEAMFHKIPIIASRVQGIKETVRENIDCLMFHVNDAKMLKSCICKLLTDNDLKNQLIEHAYNQYEKYYKYSDILSYYKNIL